MKLYFEANNGIPYDSFISDAVIGAMSNGIDVIPFSDIKVIPTSNDVMIIGYINTIEEYVGNKLPVINDIWALDYYKRETNVIDISEIDTFPIFLKPYDSVKTFTGFVAFNKNDLETMTYGYNGLVKTQPVIDFYSEYRVFIKNRQIVGIKHYNGDPFMVLDKDFVNLVLKESYCLNEYAYTLDFGIDSNGTNYLIEVNDAICISNYGLEPSIYFSMIRERWFQFKNNFSK